jgi:general secretion pathway protein F
MTRFKYTSMSLDGTCSTQERDIDSLGALKQELEQQRRILVSAEAIKVGGAFSWRGTVSPRVVTSFLRELSLILRSGMPLTEALDLAAQDAQSSLSGAITALRRQLVSGASFVQALEQQSGFFTPDIVAMARVGEATGDLGGVFRALADERSRSHTLLDKVNSAIRYPAFLIFMATSVLLFFMLHVIPQFSGLFSEQKKPPNGLAAGVFELSNWLVANQTNVMVGVIVVLIGSLLLSRVPGAKKVIFRSFTALPVIGELILMRRSALLLCNMSVLLDRGVPLVEALQVLEDLFGADTKEDFAKLKDIVRQGGRLNEALISIRILPALAVRMLKIGEETGELAKTSGEAGQLYMEKLEKRLAQVTGMIGPAAIIFIAGMIGTMMAAVMTAILSVNDMAM